MRTAVQQAVERGPARQQAVERGPARLPADERGTANARPSLVARFGDAKTPWKGIYTKGDGKTYRERGPWTQTGVNVTHSLDEIHDYVRSLPVGAVMPQHDPENDVPYASIDDFVATMRMSCRPGGPFVWPGENLKYNQYLAIALHHLPPGKAVLIKNAAVIPEKFLKSKPKRPSDEAGTRGVTESKGDRQGRPGEEAGNRGITEPAGGTQDVSMTPVEAAGEQSRQQPKKFRTDSGITPFAKNEPAPHPGQQFRYLDDANTPELHDQHEIAYHGTYPMLVPRIISEGLKPSLGAGSDGLHAHYGVVTPGVYVSPSWHCATNYPMKETTGPIKVGNSKRGVGVCC